MNIRFSVIAFILCSVSVFSIAAIAQSQGRDSARPSITINTDLVLTWAQVTNRKHDPSLPGLGIEDFQVREEGQRQQISFVKQGQPVSVVLLVDGMTCVYDPSRWYRRREEILNQFGDNSEIALMAWDSDTAILLPFTTNKQVVADKMSDKLNFFIALNGPLVSTVDPVRPGRTRYRPAEAIYQAAKYIEEAASPQNRKIIIMISYSGLWLSTKHEHTAEQVKAKLKKTGTTVYGLVHNERDVSVKGRILSVFMAPGYSIDHVRGVMAGTLGQFVGFTGGTTLKGEWERCDEIFLKLAKMIGTAYTIGYYPHNDTFDGDFRRLDVKLTRSGKAKAGGATIKTRDGYYATRSLAVSADNLRR